jgi:hypothetical protein
MQYKAGLWLWVFATIAQSYSALHRIPKPFLALAYLRCAMAAG